MPEPATSAKALAADSANFHATAEQEVEPARAVQFLTRVVERGAGSVLVVSDGSGELIAVNVP